MTLLVWFKGEHWAKSHGYCVESLLSHYAPLGDYDQFSFFLFFFFATWLADQGSNPWPLQWKGGILITGPPGESLGM